MKRKITFFTISIIMLLAGKIYASERISKEELNRSSYFAMQEEIKQNEIMLLRDTVEEPTGVEKWDISATEKDNVTATLYSDGVLKITGIGEMKWWYQGIDVPWYSVRSVIKTVIIQSGVTNIGAYAFQDCSKLISVTIPKSVIIIATHAFEDCTSLTSIDIPEKITSIAPALFYGCTSLTNVIIPKSVTDIYNHAFQKCSSLSNIIIPEGVTTIGYDAFTGCKSLTSVNIPESVTNIREDVFEDCNNLTNINVSENNLKYSSENGILFDKNKTKLLKYPEGKVDIQQYEIPNTIMSIESYAFYNCSSLVNVVIPKGVTNIGYSAFRKCSSMTNIIIPAGVINIGRNTFQNCSSLINITIPEGVTNIGYLAFEDCTNLKNINVYCNSYAENYVKENYSDKLQVIHNYNIKSTSESVCEQGGKIVYECSNCKDTYSEDVPAKGHTPVIDSRVESTCTEKGKTEGSHCSVCNKVLVAQEEIPALGHYFGEWKVTKEASCIEEGIKERECNNCDEEQTEVITKLSHSYKAKVTNPTCTQNGYTTYTCTRCNDSYTDNEVEALGHSYETKIIAPTKTEQGYIEHTCSRCNDTYKDNYVPALGEDELVMNVNEIENQYEVEYVQGYYYVKVQPGTTKENLRNQIVANGEYEILNKDRQAKEEEILATGDIIKFKAKEKIEYIVVVKGDMNCDGKVTLIDLIKANAVRINGSENNLTKAKILAVDLNNTGKIELRDIMSINRVRINSSITQ